RAHTGRDFSPYKRSTILRRIQRRMQMRQIEELPEYLDLLRTGADEVRALGDDLLITVTNFFRDRDAYETLEAEVIPRLFEGKGPEDSIRVWSVGCATGEEAYSLAILLLEEASRRAIHPRPPCLRQRPARALAGAGAGGILPRGHRGGRARGAAASLLPPRGRRLSHPAGSAGADRLRAA